VRSHPGNLQTFGGGEYSFDLGYDDSMLSLEAIQRTIAYQLGVLRRWMALGGSVVLEQTIPALASLSVMK